MPLKNTKPAELLNRTCWYTIRNGFFTWSSKRHLASRCKGSHFKVIWTIHRSNLVGMGVLPLCFKEGQGADDWGLMEQKHSLFLLLMMAYNHYKTWKWSQSNKMVLKSGLWPLASRYPFEVDYYRNGGILQQLFEIWQSNNAQPSISF